MRVDLTINIPTMISIAALIVTTSATGVGLYYSLDKRQAATDYAVSTLVQRVEKSEAAVAALKLEQAAQNQTLRNDIKSDISEIKGMLNEVIFGRRPSAQLKEWRK